MLAAIIANLQNINPPGPAPRPPMVKIDRGGGGALWGTGFDIVDIGRALDAFREIPGEHPVARAARRTQHVGDYLRWSRQRDNREAAAFLTGAALAESIAAERIAAAESRTSETGIRELIAIVDDVRGAAAPAASPPTLSRRGQHDGSGAGVVIGLGLAFGLVALIARGR